MKKRIYFLILISVQRIAIGNNYTNTDFELFASSPEQGLRVLNGRIGFNDCYFWPQYLKYERTGSCIGNLEFWTKHGALDQAITINCMQLVSLGQLHAQQHLRMV